MASNEAAVRAVLDALQGVNAESRYVFNGNCLYCDAKPVGWIDEDFFCLKNTGKNLPETRGLLTELPNCKRHPSFIVPKNDYSAPWFRAVIQATADALPEKEKRW
ncbi:MAG: hypothetical protein ABFC62_07020 [Clostridiaceae bacterium]|nr:hypothetical protein [Eubacteriales bacterium]